MIWRSLLPLVMAITTCSGPAKMPPRVPTAEELLVVIRAHQQHARTLRADARVEFWDNTQGDRLKGRISMWVMRDGHLRIEFNTQVGMLAALAVTRDGFQLLDVKNDKYFTGQAAPCNVERIIHVALPPEQIAHAMLGDAPLLPHESARVSWNGDAKRWVLTLALAGGGSEVIELSEPYRHLERAELRDPGGKRRWWLEHDDFVTIKGIAMPERSRFQQGDKADQDVILKIKSQDVNLDPPPEAWVIEAPSGLVQQELLCEGPR
ncbi:MAG TPA: DUF4292 domain-containing protein [Polyangia bacterium]|nr:DUF4292 domain-containing protein [Polyangia bacterium]